MGYFAVLSTDDDKQIADHLQVKRLHVNLWALRGLWFGRRLLHCDVGIELVLTDDSAVPDGTEVSAVEMLLPFRVEEGKWSDGTTTAMDLYDAVVSEHSGPLIFGAPVTIHSVAQGRSTVTFEEEKLEAGRISPSNTKAVEGHVPKSDSALYAVALHRPLKKGESVYLRMRWRVFGAAPLWRWARPESGARIDFRVCDTRQGPIAQRDPAFIDRILAISQANVFVMVPGHLSPTNVSPEAKHIRTLEPGAWSAYLIGVTKRRWVARNLLVYGWHTKIGSSITEDRPLRVFLALHRPGGTPGWLQIVYAAIGFLLGWGLLATSGQVSGLSVEDLDAKTVGGLVGVTSVLSLWTALQRLRPFFADRAIETRRKLRAVERFLLSI